MPTYFFRNEETGEEFEKFMRISELDVFLEENPTLTQLPPTKIYLHSGRGMSKPDSGFRDILKRIKDNHSGGFTKSNINTF